MNLANKISVGRILIIPFFVGSLVYSRLDWAAVIFIIAVLSDALDGYIARIKGERTELGALLDPIADKLLLMSAFICFSTPLVAFRAAKLPPYVPIIIISRDIVMGLGCVVIYVIKGTLEIRPTWFGKITTMLQMATIAALLVQLKAVSILWNVTIIFTIVSGLHYISKGSKLLNEA